MGMATMSLRSRAELFVLVKVLTYTFDHLRADHLGFRLDHALDDRFGAKRSEEVQQRMVLWLKDVIAELEADHGPVAHA